MECRNVYAPNDMSLLPLCILRDDYDGLHRTGSVHVNDFFKPNSKPLSVSLRSSADRGVTFTEYHFHKGVEMLRINEGEATVIIAGKSYQAIAGDILIVNPYEAHAIYLANPKMRFSRSCLIFDPDDIFSVKSSKNIFSLLKSIRFKNHIPHSNTAEKICSSVDKIVSAAGYGDGGDAVGVLASLMELYATVIRSDCCALVGIKAHYREEFVTRVSDYIEQNLFSGITTSAAASYSKYSVEHFCRMFRACFGTTFRDYVTERRIAVAKQKIDLGDVMSISTLAEECGFTSHNHFTNMFRRHIGVSPSEYMKGKRNEI